MNPIVYADYEQMSRAAARWLGDALRRRPDILLCLASGATPMRAYELFAQQHARRLPLFRRFRVIKLDEWGGLAMDDPASCERHLQEAILQPLRLNGGYVGFRGDAPNPEAECARIQRWLNRNGPIDACVLGLGANGHLAFNEPARWLRPHAHVATLSPESLRHDTLARGRTRPRYGLTLGMADLSQARRILLLVSGASKAGPLRELLRGVITPRFPASLLWLHPDVTLLCDQEAASGLLPAQRNGRMGNGRQERKRQEREGRDLRRSLLHDRQRDRRTTAPRPT
ncbi:MAG: 6-phosphogluconolactonase [Vicinamibacteraceae bacterium]